MKYHFGMLSEKKREELAALEVMNMYGTKETFINSCATSEDETVVFCGIAHAHDYNGSGDQDEYFLAYGSWQMKVYLKHSVKKEVDNDITIFIHTYDIKDIFVAPEKREEMLKREREIKDVIKEIIPVYEQGLMSRKNNQRVFKVINC